jgi:hypothetical protein
LFSGSDRGTTQATEDTSKYFNTSINFNQANHFNQIDQKKRKVLESFNLVTVGKPKFLKKNANRAINTSYKNSPRSINGINFENRMVDKFDLANKIKARDALYSRITNSKYRNNIKNFRKIKSNQRRTATKSPNHQEVSFNSQFNDFKPKLNTIYNKPILNFNMTMYGQNMSVTPKYSNAPSTSFSSYRTKPRLNSSLENKVQPKFRLKSNHVHNNNFMSSNPATTKATVMSLNSKFASYINRFNS